MGIFCIPKFFGVFSRLYGYFKYNQFYDKTPLYVSVYMEQGVETFLYGRLLIVSATRQ